MEESIAEYGGWRAVEALAGASAAELLRRGGFQYYPIYSASAYFRIATAGEDKPLAQTVARERFAAARNIAYSKGAFVFYMLAQQLGAAQFRDAIRSLMRRRAFEEISWAEFRAPFERASQQYLGQFFEQWFNRVGAPDFTLDWRQQEGGLVGVIRQPAPFYAVKLDIAAAGSQGEAATFAIDVAAAAETTFSLPVDFSVREATLDPDYKVLRWTPEYHYLL